MLNFFVLFGKKLKDFADFSYGKIARILLLLIILIQFFLVSIIFFENRKSDGQLNARLDAQQAQLNEKLNMLQSNMTRLQMEIYRRK